MQQQKETSYYNNQLLNIAKKLRQSVVEVKEDNYEDDKFEEEDDSNNNSTTLAKAEADKVNTTSNVNINNPAIGPIVSNQTIELQKCKDQIAKMQERELNLAKNYCLLQLQLDLKDIMKKPETQIISNDPKPGNKSNDFNEKLMKQIMATKILYAKQTQNLLFEKIKNKINAEIISRIKEINDNKVNVGGNTGGNTGGNVGGNTGGNTGGNVGGNDTNIDELKTEIFKLKTNIVELNAIITKQETQIKKMQERELNLAKNYCLLQLQLDLKNITSVATNNGSSEDSGSDISDLTRSVYNVDDNSTIISSNNNNPFANGYIKPNIAFVPIVK